MRYVTEDAKTAVVLLIKRLNSTRLRAVPIKARNAMATHHLPNCTLLTSKLKSVNKSKIMLVIAKNSNGRAVTSIGL